MCILGAARKYRVWPCHGAKEKVGDRWKLLFADLRNGHQYTEHFAGMSDSRVVSQFASMLRTKRKHRADALKRPDAARPPQLTGDEALYVRAYFYGSLGGCGGTTATCIRRNSLPR